MSTGKISVQDMVYMLRELGEPLTIEDVEALLREVSAIAFSITRLIITFFSIFHFHSQFLTQNSFIHSFIRVFVHSFL
jgi:hypothetical protein